MYIYVMEFKYKNEIIKIQRFFKNYLFKNKILYNPLIIAWIKNESPFKDLNKNQKKINLELMWGNRILCRYIYIKIKHITKQWTSSLGEFIVFELLKRENKTWRPKIIGGFKPDLETDNNIYEVKNKKQYINLDYLTVKI